MTESLFFDSVAIKSGISAQTAFFSFLFIDELGNS